MAEAAERTEAPTPRRLERAREDGQAPVSREASGLAVLAAALLVLVLAIPDAAARSAAVLRVFLEQPDRLTTQEATALALRAALPVAAPLAVAAVAAASAAVLLQTGFLVSPAAVLPDLARLDPRNGLRRIGGPVALMETGKALLKMAVVGWAAWMAIDAMLPALGGALGWDAGRLLQETGRAVARLLAAMLAVQAALAALDIAVVRFRHVRGLRMSRQELRDEQRESEGDPRIKARRRTIQRQRARQRMMAAVPKAAVVVTNPAHYAVALAYERGAGAPRVVAKGVDEAAARIREVAMAHRVPLVANPPLARALHRLELETEIPAEHYKAVAEIIAYVWRLRTRVAA